MAQRGQIQTRQLKWERYLAEELGLDQSQIVSGTLWHEESGRKKHLVKWTGAVEVSEEQLERVSERMRLEDPPSQAELTSALDDAVDLAEMVYGEAHGTEAQRALERLERLQGLQRRARGQV